MVTRVLATCELGRGYGHVANAAAIARGLSRRGVETVFATRDLSTASRVSDRPFARLIQAPLYTGRVRLVPTLTYAQAISDGGMHDADEATVLVAAWLQLFDLLGPDGIAAEFAPASLLAAHIAGLPAVRFGSAWAAPPAGSPLRSVMPWVADDVAARLASCAAADAVVRTVCRRFGAALIDGVGELLGCRARLLATWPELDHYGPAAGEVYYGPMTGLGGSFRPAWPEGDGPRTFIYMSAHHPAAANLEVALSDLAWPVIWHGEGVHGSGRTISKLQVPVDTAAVLKGAAICIGRGGHGTACEALRFGCRQFMFPDTLESSLLAWRMQRLHLALSMPERSTAGEIRTVLASSEDAAHRDSRERSRARYATYAPARAEDQLAAAIAVAFGA